MQATKALQVGDGMTEGVFLGPLQNKMQYDRVNNILKDVQTTKGTIAFGGNQDTASGIGKGYFVQPTVVDNPSDTSRIVTEEPFGKHTRRRQKHNPHTICNLEADLDIFSYPVRPHRASAQIRYGGRGHCPRQQH